MIRTGANRSAWRFTAMLTALFASMPSLAQTVPAPTVDGSAQQGDPASRPDDIVVEGLRDLNDPDALVNKRTLHSNRAEPQRKESEYLYSASEQFARCAIQSPPHDARVLHLALDSTMNSVRQDNAQRRFIMLNANCAKNSELALRIGQSVEPFKGSEKSEQIFYYDRGAMFVRAVQVFAPDVTPTTEQMKDPAVDARFVTRERPLARLRLQQDVQYLKASICLVRQQPDLSARLVRSDLSQTTRAVLASVLVNKSKSCFGGARHVYFDTVQLRFYLADALYRWIVAIKGVDTLIPWHGAAPPIGQARPPR